jgi:histidinol-phosphate aminotransferase
MKYQRALLKNVTGYVPGEQPKPGERIIKLNTNENPYPPSPRVMEAILAVGADGLRKYPDPNSVELRRTAAELYGFAGPEWAIAGNGSDELLAMIIRTFTDPGDTILSAYPTYSLYDTLVKLHGANYETVDLDANYQLSPETYSRKGRVFFLVRPNAPSGVSSPRADVEKLCKSFDGLVVIDEAYADFDEDNCMDFPRRFENAIVTRTFSKSYSLCGLRAGLAFARPELIHELMKTKDSYNLNAASQAGATAALRDQAHLRANSQKVIATRNRMTAELRKLGFSVPDSRANFVLAKWTRQPDTKAIFQALRQRNIVVRYFEHRGLTDALRISVGTDPETDALLAALAEILK